MTARKTKVMAALLLNIVLPTFLGQSGIIFISSEDIREFSSFKSNITLQC